MGFCRLSSRRCALPLAWHSRRLSYLVGLRRLPSSPYAPPGSSDFVPLLVLVSFQPPLTSLFTHRYLSHLLFRSQDFSATAWPTMSAFWGWSAVAGSSRGRSPGRPSAMTSAVPPHRSPSSPCASAPLHKAAPLPKALGSKATAAAAPPRPPLGPRAPPVWSQPAVRFGFAPPLALVARAASCGVAAPKVVLRTVLIVSLNKG